MNKTISYILIPLILLVFIECKTNKKVLNNFDVENKIIISDTLIGEFIFAKEICSSPNQVDFCFDGIGQIFRLNSGSFIVGLDSNDILESYKKGYYTASFPLKIDSMFYFDNIDSIFDFNSEYNTTITLRVKNKLLDKNIKKYYKKNSIINEKLKFDGIFYYKYYKIKIKYVYSGEKCISIPNFKIKSNRENNYISQRCKTYSIIEIYNIEPVTNL